MLLGLFREWFGGPITHLGFRYSKRTGKPPNYAMPLEFPD